MRLRHLALLLGAPVVAVVALALLDTGPDVPMAAGLTVAACTGGWLLATAGRLLAPPPPAVPEVEPPGAPPDLRITTLRQALAAGGADSRLAERIYRQLVDVVDDELMASHGVDRTADPEAARSVLGAELFAFVAEPDTARQLTVRKLERVVTQIEHL